MNRLVKLKIEGFKSIQHMEMNFGNINILLGGNGAGKSNLISFLKC
jgi:predicted ATPase